MKKFFEVPIRRYTEDEAKKAIADLEGRGYELVFPLKEINKMGTSQSSYNYQQGRYRNRVVNASTVWFAKMRKVEE